MFQEDLNKYFELDAEIRQKLNVLGSTHIVSHVNKPWFTGEKENVGFIFWFSDVECVGLPNYIMFPAFWWGFGSKKKEYKVIENDTLSFHTQADVIRLFSMNKRLTKEQAEEVLKRNAIKNWSIAKEINGIKVTEREIR